MANRLSGASSPYLRSAAHQPVQWYPWGEEAFARAQAEDRPILLDIGAVWCHWCHVIDRESYDDPEIAEIINRHFVPVKVDRDERPDIDVRYQNAVGAITGQGGWPLTAALTPEGKVFFGGTYFPPQSMMGRPSFRQVLLAVAEFYRTNRAQAHAYANELQQALARLGAARASEAPLSPALVGEAVRDITRQFDLQNGGFGGAPKFPHCGAIELLLRWHDRTGDPHALLVATRTLEKMGRGGVFDQLGGGFHRYSVDASWVVPHFEKMLYDNAELLRNYVHAYQATGTPLFREIADGIVRYVLGTLCDRERGGFLASQDADQDLGDDGDYYTWTEEEARAALEPEEWEVARAAFHLEGPGEMAHDRRRHVLFVHKDPDAIAALLGASEDDVRRRLGTAKRRLLAARGMRKAPFVDPTVYTSWNGMMISACLEAWRALGRTDAREAALRALERLIADAYGAGSGQTDPRADGGGGPRGFHHVAGGSGVTGLLDDQVQSARALLDAFEVTAEGRYLALAEATMRYVLEAFQTPWGALQDRAGDARGTPAGPPGLDVAFVPVQDAPTPAGNAVGAIVLDRLAMITGEQRYREAAGRILEACAPGQAPHGLHAATLALALDLHLNPPLHVVVVGPRGGREAASLHAAALRAYRPGLVVHAFDPAAAAGRLPALVAGTGDGRAARAFVCGAAACAPPVSTSEELSETIRTFGRAPAA
jgi:uncharacterized protein YyaL (SSP411 family)